MKSTGIVRKIDSLGRIVLPIELRKSLAIDVKDPVEILVKDDCIVLKKYEHTCIICGERKPRLRVFKGKLLCTECNRKLLSL